MINSSITRYLVGAILCLCLSSCKQGEVYYKFEPIPQNEWSRDQHICFSLDSSSINPHLNYAISLEIIHNISYPYKNLYLYLDQTLQDSISHRDTIEFILVDDFGKWQGSGNGATRQISLLYKTNLTIDTALHNEIYIRHAMQDLNLKGIEKIGLKVY